MPTNKLPVALPTLPGSAKVTKFSDEGIIWEMSDQTGMITGTDVHVIDKGVAHV